MLSNFFARSAAPSPGNCRVGQQQQILLGWNDGIPQEPVGVAPGLMAPNGHSQLVTYGGDAPLITCAMTGAGKGRSVLIPNLLTYPGPIIAVDIKGELYQVSGRRRREMGQHVVVLDPFHLVTERSDSLNPLDLLTLPRSDLDSDAEMVASLLAVGNEYSKDPFWNNAGRGLTSAFIAHIAGYPANERHLGQLGGWLFHEDMDYAIAVLLDSKEVKSRMARQQFIAYMAAPPEQTRPGIRTMACSYMRALGSEQVAKTLRPSSFRLMDVFDGKPLSIYICIPPDKLDSHQALLRLWVGTLLTTITRRKEIPRQRTLFLLDECAQLGSLPILRQAITLLRGSGLQTWTFWQDLSQLRQCYPNDYENILNNSGMLQIFGINNHNMAKDWSELLGLRAQDLDQLAAGNAAVRRQGQGSMVCRRPDYLKDEMFAGLFDANQRFALQA